MGSIWRKTATLPSFPPLAGDTGTRVLVVGGGVAGILCTYFLTQAGVDCLLLEAGRLSSYAREQGMGHLLLSVGGNVCAVGGKLDGTPWQVGIENPQLESQKPYVGTVRLSGKSIVTSGDYQRYYTVGGKRYCHIIRPDTGMPSGYFPSVSVLAEDSGLADALSTALFNMELEEGLALVEAWPGVEALWILEDGGIRCSSGFKFNEEK